MFRKMRKTSGMTSGNVSDTRTTIHNDFEIPKHSHGETSDHSLGYDFGSSHAEGTHADVILAENTHGTTH